MNGFTYFFPTRGRPTRDQIDAGGVSYAFPGDTMAFREVLRGPAGQAGSVASPDTEASVRYNADAQTWRQVPKSDIWVGYETDRPPTPADLIVADVTPGHEVTLGGQQWVIPVARSVNPAHALPETYGVDDEGQWIKRGVINRHRQLWEYATEWWDYCIAHQFDSQEDDEDDEKDTVTIRFDHGADAALCGLATNYRVSAIEVDLLALFDESRICEILMAMVDWPTVLGFLKKKRTGTRHLQHVRWKQGRDPHYCPSLADLFWLEAG